MTQSIGPPSLAQGTRIAVGFSTSISRFIPACGELSKPSWAIVQLDGSSPLARGTQDLDRLGYVADRFIPAYAGNSLDMCRSRCTFPVHPRLRGELFSLLALLARYSGSSPLTRGTRSRMFPLRSDRRFIPAYAGNSDNGFTLGPPPPVHPRLRGELGIPAGNLRGIVRFIPAYAGNSYMTLSDVASASVHPRLRGELT